MNRLLSLLLLLVVTCYSFAQPKNKVYKLRILTKDGQTKKGYLRELNDSTLAISPTPAKSITEVIAYQAISKIKARDRKAIVKGAIIGAASGAVIGAFVGAASYEPVDCSGTWICIDYGPTYDIMGGALLGGMAGALIGLAIGSSSKEIQTDKRDPEQLRNELKKYIVN